MEGNLLANREHGNRKPSDFYPTPPEVTMALLDYLQIPLKQEYQDTIIWEPACGEGHMSKVLESRGYKVISTDLYDRGYGKSGVDFPLTDCCREFAHWIITNPPFSQSEEFIERCIKQGVSFALLFKSQYWHATGRKAIFDKYRPQAVLPLTWRPNFLFADKTRKNGKPLMEVYWTVWGDVPAKYTIYQPLQRPNARRAATV